MLVRIKGITTSLAGNLVTRGPRTLKDPHLETG
jgi:hypothetical protein